MTGIWRGHGHGRAVIWVRSTVQYGVLKDQWQCLLRWPGKAGLSQGQQRKN